MACCGELNKAGWLRLVIVTTTLCVTVQIYAGLFAHSLALLSDAVHGVVDVFTYALAYLAEQLKGSSVVGKRNLRLARIVDIAGFAASICFMGLASVYVTDAACDRLSAQQLERVAGHQALLEVEHPAPGGAVNGRIMLAFSVALTAANLSLAALYPDDDEPRRGSKSKSALSRAHSLFHVHGPQCGHFDWDQQAASDKKINLNVLVQWVHVVMDGLRGLLLLICSGLICLGWIDAGATDAVLSIAVCVMVILGSLSMVPKAYEQLRAVLDEPPEAPPLENEPLLKGQ